MRKIQSVPEFEILSQQKGWVWVEFGAKWCPPCKVLLPILEELSEKYPTVPIYQVDVDDAPDLAEKQKIKSMPTLQILFDGERKEVWVGFQGKQKYFDWFQKLLQN